MRIKFLVDEDFVNYKKPSMFIGSIACDFKCCHEQNLSEQTCQNEPWFSEPIIEFSDSNLCKRYLDNPITQGICIGGLEPMLQFQELLIFIRCLRDNYHCDDTVIIYTGYYPNELKEELPQLKQFKNIIIKFGRYIPGHLTHIDPLLGVNLASDNQYALQIS